MYELSLYTYMFHRGTESYLYNAQSNFFGKVSTELIEILEKGKWDELDEETLKLLQKHHVIELKGHTHDYFDLQQLKFASRNYNPTSMGLVIAPTTACNFDCPYCFEPKLSPKTMSGKTIVDLMKFIRSHPDAKEIRLTWYGGEPLLAFKQIKEIYEEFKKDGIPAITHTTIVTNGSLINEEICDFFKEKKLDLMQITIDGTEESHDRTRCFKANKGGSFRTIYNNLRIVRERIPDCKIAIRVNINKNNKEEFVKLYKKIKVDFKDDKMINVYPGIIREETPDGRNLLPSCIQSADMPELYAYFKSQGIDQPLFPERKQRGCMIYSQNSHIIGPEGEIYKCWNDVTVPERIIGNISDGSLTNPTLLTQYMTASTPYREECRDCKVLPICDGGCGYYTYKNLFAEGEFNQCSAMKDMAVLEKALLDGSLAKITKVKEEE